MTLPILETERLILRPYKLEDASEFERLITPREVTDGTFSYPHPVPAGWGVERINLNFSRYGNREHNEFVIGTRATGQFIGGIGMTVTPRHKRGHLGYWLGVDFWGQGYATEAARAIVRYGFGTLGLYRIEAGHYPRNPASGRVLEKIGMRLEGTLRGHLLKGDVFEDTVMYARLVTDGEP